MIQFDQFNLFPSRGVKSALTIMNLSETNTYVLAFSTWNTAAPKGSPIAASWMLGEIAQLESTVLVGHSRSTTVNLKSYIFVPFHFSANITLNSITLQRTDRCSLTEILVPLPCLSQCGLLLVCMSRQNGCETTFCAFVYHNGHASLRCWWQLPQKLESTVNFHARVGWTWPSGLWMRGEVDCSF